MGDASYTQTSFLGGEWSQSSQGRIDLPTYRTAMNVCLNGLPLEAGAWVRRPGFLLAAPTRGGLPARLISYTFQQSAPYNMEFSDGYLRFFSGTSLVMTNDAQTVSSISSANPAKVATATAHGWATGNTVQFSALGVNDALLQNRQVLITVTSSTEFTIADAITGTAIDGSTLGTFVSGTVSRVLEFQTVYSNQAWSSLRSVQTDTAAVLLHPTIIPQILTRVTAPVASPAASATFTLAQSNFKDGPYLDPFTNGVQATPSAKVGIINLTLGFAAYSATKAYSVGDFVTYSAVNYKSLVDQNVNHQPDISATQWVAANAGTAIAPNGFVGTDVGRLVRLFSEPSIWTVGAVYATGDNVAYPTAAGGTAYYTCVTGHTATLALAPGISLDWGINTAGAVWSWGKITALTNLIDRALAGSVNIGTLTQNGGVAASFDGTTTKPLSTSSTLLFSDTTTDMTSRAYIGKNYSGASAQAIASGTLFPPTDVGLVAYSSTPGGVTVNSVTVNLRGKATAPASSSDGTLLGSTVVAAPYKSPVAVVSNNTATTWNYVWFEIVFVGSTLVSGTAWFLRITDAQAQFFSAVSGAVGTSVSVQIMGSDLLYTTPIRTWRMGLYSDTTGWPSCGTYHEGRLWLSGAVGNRLDGSKPNDLYNFAPTLPTGQVTDSNAIAYTFNAPDINTIFWMVPDAQGIICGTQAGEWLVQATASNLALTPTSMQAHRVTKVGCANIEPRRTEHTLVFVQRYVRKVMEYFADVFSGKLSAPNLSEKAKHLTTSGIVELAYQQELAPVIWARCADGSLIGATYKRDALTTSQGPTFVGWHRHTLGSGRKVESICVGPSSDGTLDSLAVVTNDVATSIRHVEVMCNFFDENAALPAAQFLDDAVVPTMSQNVTITGTLNFQIGGLWALNGKSVTVFAGGLDLSEYTVANGVVNIPYGAANGLFTSTFVSSYSGTMPILAGFIYNSDGQIVRPATQAESGARNGPGLGKKRRSHHYAALLVNTQNIFFGTTFTALNRANLTTSPDGGALLTLQQTKSGIHWQTLTDDNGFDSMLCWRVTRVYPGSIAALTGFLDTKDQ